MDWRKTAIPPTPASRRLLEWIAFFMYGAGVIAARDLWWVAAVCPPFAWWRAIRLVM